MIHYQKISRRRDFLVLTWYTFIMVREITLQDAKREIQILALKIWASVAVSLLVLAFVVTRLTNNFLIHDVVREFQGTVVPPLVLGVVFFTPFAVLTAYKRWIWSDASSIWKYPAAAISHIREGSSADIKAQQRPLRDVYSDADKSIRILPDYIQARAAAVEEVLRTGTFIDNGPRKSFLENSVYERPLRWYEMFIIPAIIILVPSGIFGFCYLASLLGSKICWP